MANKRKDRRKIKRLPVSFMCGNRTFNGISSDLSYTGLFIRTRNAVKPGHTLKMVLALDDNRKVALKGITARAIKTEFIHFKNGMGIKLTSVPEKYQNYLNELLQV